MIPWNHKFIKPFNHVSMNPRNGEPWKIGTLKLWTHSINSLSVFAGGRDKRGGPILTFPARSNHDRIKQEDLRRLVTYLSTVPRYSSTHGAVSSQAPRRRCSVRHRRPGIKPVSSLDLSWELRAPRRVWDFVCQALQKKADLWLRAPSDLNRVGFSFKSTRRRFPLKQLYMREASYQRRHLLPGKPAEAQETWKASVMRQKWTEPAEKTRGVVLPCGKDPIYFKPTEGNKFIKCSGKDRNKQIWHSDPGLICSR